MSGKRKFESDVSATQPKFTQTLSGDTNDSSQTLSISGLHDFTPSPVINGSSVGCNGPFPGPLHNIEKIHSALNLVFTFCCSRQHLSPSFYSIKTAVESHIGRTLAIKEVAAVVALRPDAIKFSYVDETTLQMGISAPERYTNTAKYGSAKPHAISEAPITICSPDTRKEVLFFEFIDGDPRSSGKMKKIRGGRGFQAPVSSLEALRRSIDQRNQKFRDALNLFVNRCLAQNTDPISSLEERASLYIPAPSRYLTDSLPASATIPLNQKSMRDITIELKKSPWYSGQIPPHSHVVFEPRESTYGDLDFLLSQGLVNALYNAHGITRFYSHQAEALNSLHSGCHVVVSTPTCSGKSLIYQLPILHSLEQDALSRAIFIFPTKALAQDQKRSLRETLSYLPNLKSIQVETFDGDTPFLARASIRDNASVIFTNPDMLHLNILPNEQQWRSLFQHLKYVVGMSDTQHLHSNMYCLELIMLLVDELHFYNGQLGAHVSYIIRRLRRLCDALGNRSVLFISCSATMGNARSHFKIIFGVENVKLVAFDGSPAGKLLADSGLSSHHTKLHLGRKEFICWNPPFKDPKDSTSGRESSLLECSRLLRELIIRGVRTLVFCKTRGRCESLANTIRRELEQTGFASASARVLAYRGGYTAHDRRKIERDMFEGSLLGIIATTALELGIDIGSLDCVLIWGFPHTVSHLRQQSGRAGRRNGDALSILLGDSTPLDQYYMQNPTQLFLKPDADPQIDLQNIPLREGHLQCAAKELPIQPEKDAIYFGPDLEQICKSYLSRGIHGYFHCHSRYQPSPATFMSIRGLEEEHIAIIDTTNGTNTVLEDLEASRATFTIYEGGIYLHQGEKYLVCNFQPDARQALVARVHVNWTTRPREFADINPIETEAVQQLTGSISYAFYGTVRVTRKVFGFFRIDPRGRILEAIPVDNPPVIRYAKGVWLDVPKAALELLRAHKLDPVDAIHATQHILMKMVPTLVATPPGDIKATCAVAKKEHAREGTTRKRYDRLTIYDASEVKGNSGASFKVFGHIDSLLTKALQTVQECTCVDDGCPNCVVLHLCSEGNAAVTRVGAEVVLGALLNRDVVAHKVPLADGNGIDTNVAGGPLLTLEVTAKQLGSGKLE